MNDPLCRAAAIEQIMHVSPDLLHIAAHGTRSGGPPMPHARRTRRVAEAQSRVGPAFGGEGAACLIVHFAMPASANTVLQLIRRIMPLRD
jgi:hypothetical protein